MRPSMLLVRSMPFALLVAAGLNVTQDLHAQSLPGTREWTMPADPAASMVDGIHRKFDKMLAASFGLRDETWALGERDGDFRERRSERLDGLIGTLPPPEADDGPFFEILVPRLVSSSHVPGTSRNSVGEVRIDSVRWKVADDVWMEGSLVRRETTDSAKERNHTRFLGVVLDNPTPGKEFGSHIELAIRLANAGGLILVPDLIDRSDRWSGDDKVRYTNLSHREWIWRMAWETGRSPLGYEVSGVRQGLKQLARMIGPNRDTVKGSFIFGHGDGGQIALLAGALGAEADVVWVSGYFQDRTTTQWLEPIDRTIWRQALEFQDAELAAMTVGSPQDMTRVLIDRTPGPQLPASLPPRNGRDDAADGSLRPATSEEIDRELIRARKLSGASSSRIMDAIDREAAIARIAEIMATPIPTGPKIAELAGPGPMTDFRILKSPNGPEKIAERAELRSNFETWTRLTQSHLRTSELRRGEFWKNANPQNPGEFARERDRLRDIFQEELMGRMPAPTVPLVAETKLVLDEASFRGYAVNLPMDDDVFAYGILLLPKDLKPGEKRPVVVCQHGLEGRPEDIVDPARKTVYHAYGAELANRGYIVFAPQNPYIGHERFRTIQRKAWPLGQSLFAVIIRQHERILDWLETLENVDPRRIAFYGLSYGGKSAMRIPAALPRYCLSICSADFNEWVVKCTNTDRGYSYMFTIEYDMYEWDLASRFNYAEMASLIAPRPFMVERGHFDGVAPDEWIGYEFAKVKRTYDLLGVGERARIAYFNRGHEIDGTATFEFLAEHLNWPRGAEHLKRSE